MLAITNILRGLMIEIPPLVLTVIGSVIMILLTIIGTLLMLDRKDMKEAIKAIGTGLEAVAKEFKEDIRRVHERVDTTNSNLAEVCGHVKTLQTRCEIISKGREK